jgi:hypothetical protein
VSLLGTPRGYHPTTQQRQQARLLSFPAITAATSKTHSTAHHILRPQQVLRIHRNHTYCTARLHVLNPKFGLVMPSFLICDCAWGPLLVNLKHNTCQIPITSAGVQRPWWDCFAEFVRYIFCILSPNTQMLKSLDGTLDARSPCTSGESQGPVDIHVYEPPSAAWHSLMSQQGQESLLLPPLSQKECKSHNTIQLPKLAITT